MIHDVKSMNAYEETETARQENENKETPSTTNS